MPENFFSTLYGAELQLARNILRCGVLPVIRTQSPACTSIDSSRLEDPDGVGSGKVGVGRLGKLGMAVGGVKLGTVVGGVLTATGGFGEGSSPLLSAQTIAPPPPSSTSAATAATAMTGPELLLPGGPGGGPQPPGPIGSCGPNPPGPGWLHEGPPGPFGSCGPYPPAPGWSQGDPPGGCWAPYGGCWPYWSGWPYGAGCPYGGCCDPGC